MTIKQQGGVFGRNPAFNDVETNSLDVNGPLSVGGQSVLTGDVAVGLPSPSAAVHVYNATPLDHIKIDGPVVNRSLNFSTSNSSRWNVYANGSAETGSNAGSDFTIARYTDAGGFLGSAFLITRSNADITTYGNVIMANGKGIDFSATSGTGTSELFDDYEEGTWTPVLADAQTGGNTLSAAATYGFYTKVGNVVNAWCSFININTAGATAGNQVALRGLPFTVTGTDLSVRYPAAFTLAAVSTTLPGFRATPNTTVALSNILVSDMLTGAADIWANIIYRA